MFLNGSSKRGKSIITSKLFLERVKEDSTSFLKNLVVDAEVNG